MDPQTIEEILHRENLRLASISKRASAFFLDELLLSLLLVISLWESFEKVNDTIELIALTQQFTLEYIMMKIVYQTFFVYRYGATLGKIALRLKVVHLPEVANPPLLPAFNRAVIRIVSEMFFYLGFVWAMMDPAKRAWHDLTAKTIVIES